MLMKYSAKHRYKCSRCANIPVVDIFRIIIYL